VPSQTGRFGYGRAGTGLGLLPAVIEATGDGARPSRAAVVPLETTPAPAVGPPLALTGRSRRGPSGHPGPVPSPSATLDFLGSAAQVLAACRGAWARGIATGGPTADPVEAPFCLATLSMGVSEPCTSC
jgi:hypothetical protein